MSDIKVCAFDPSLTGFGVSAGDKDTIEIPTSPMNEQTQSQNLQRRAQEIAARILGFVNKNYDPQDELMIVLESPSYGSKGGLVEAGWMLCEIYNRVVPFMLGGRKATIVEVPPKSLKKWATGNGNADKTMMKAAIKERWGKEFERDPKGNLSDAYALYKYGIAILNGEVDYQRIPRRGQGGKKKSAKRSTTKTSSKKSPKDKPTVSSGGDNRGRRKTRSRAG